MSRYTTTKTDNQGVQAATIRKALLERALRERQKRQKVDMPSYGEWLPQASPNYTWTWTYSRYLQRYIDRVTSGEITRLMVLLPVRHGKSELVTARYPAYALERNPSTRVVIASHTVDLAKKFSRTALSIVQARKLVELNQKRQAIGEWLTTAGGGVRAVGTGSSIAGYGFDLLLLDDIIGKREDAESKASRDHAWNWFSDDLWTRREPDASAIVTNARWHEDDIAGRILSSYDGPNWVVIKLPALMKGTPDPPDYPIKRAYNEALCPERFTSEMLIEAENIVKGFSSLFQQEPTPPEGDVFKLSWLNEDGKPEGKLRTVEKFPDRLKLTQVWDTALEVKQRSDFSSMVEGTRDPTTGMIYVSAMANEKMDFPTLAKRMKADYERVGGNCDLCAEDTAAGKPARQELRTHGIPVIPIPSGTLDKEVRAKSITQYLESGMVVFVMQPGNINDLLIKQMLMFPNAKHDDLVDAFVHLMRRLTNNAKRWSSEDIKKLLATYSEQDNISDDRRAELLEQQERLAAQRAMKA